MPRPVTIATLATLVTAIGCTTSEPAVTVSLPVTTTADAIAPVTTDLGYTVEVAQIRIAVADIELTIEGETHADASADSSSNVSSFVPPAPHPGHSAGGEVTGELLGNHILVWNGAMTPALGMATLIVGDYNGANFAFRAADAGDALAADDPLLGHTFHITGTVTRDGASQPFEAVLDVEPEAAVIGAVFDHVITETSPQALSLVFDAADPTELDTAFDGIDFFQLPQGAGTLEIAPGSTAHNILRRAIQTHDHYAVIAQ